ncbi:hypothetical protein G6L58_13570 [Agrobacterium tumefaciens]|nr:hypothetical protein [Agrobacterium tumefaciens]
MIDDGFHAFARAVEVPLQSSKIGRELRTFHRASFAIACFADLAGRL